MWCRPTKWSVRGFTSWKDDEGCGCGNGCESAIYHLILSILKTEIGQTCLRPHTKQSFFLQLLDTGQKQNNELDRLYVAITNCRMEVPMIMGDFRLRTISPLESASKGRFYLIPMVPISPWFDCGILLPLGYQNTIDKKHLYDFTKSLRTHVYIIFHGTCPRCLMDALCLVDSLACLRWKSLDLQLCWHQCQVTLDATRVWSHFLHAGWSCPLDLTSD